MNDFDNHVIRSRVKAEGFGSWVLQSKYPDGKDWTSNLWCRITAADRYLRVSGDFEPIIFAYGPADPRACVEWMGKEKHLSHYAVEKARIGSGRDACTSENTDDAREDIAARIAELHEQLTAELHARTPVVAGSAKSDSSDDPPLPDDSEWCPNAEVERLEAEIKAWQAGLDLSDEYSGREGVFMLLREVYNFESPVDSEDLIGIGARPSSALKFAHAAVRRLHALLAAEDAERQAETPDLACPTCEGAKPGECCGNGNKCGASIPRIEQALEADPYMSEIHNDNLLHLQCTACLHESCQEI